MKKRIVAGVLALVMVLGLVGCGEQTGGGSTTTTVSNEYEEVVIVRRFRLSFLTADINGYRNTLTICIVDFKGSVLAMGDGFLIHETGSGGAESQEPVIVGIHRIAVARE